MKKWIKRFFLAIVVLSLLLIAIVFYADWKISSDSQSVVYDDVDQVPNKKVALVLGASPVLRGGYPNPYFTNRMTAAKELYQAGKVRAFVVSGDNGIADYNEPQEMKNALIAEGIPDSIIYLDFAGFRTLDSVVRMKEIFGQDDFVVVSQKFHNERAIFLAESYDCKAYGYNAKDLVLNSVSYKTVVREKFARVKVFIDLLIGVEPKFLGEPIFID